MRTEAELSVGMPSFRGLCTIVAILWAMIGPVGVVWAETTPTRFFATEPKLQLPEEDSVYVVWYTEFEGEAHTLTYGPDLAFTVPATTTLLTRGYEDLGSDLWALNDRGQRTRAFRTLTRRNLYRHEARATNLIPGLRVPYFVTSSNGQETQSSAVYSLQPKVPAGQPVRILLTSDQQNRAMSPATLQKVEELYGDTLDLVLFAGDFVDTPNRVSEWIDRDNDRRPAFFPSFQGFFQEQFPEQPYRGGRILQHSPLLAVLGNHEAPGRYARHESHGDNLNTVDNQPQPRWYAEIRYDQKVASGEITPPADSHAAEAFRAQWIQDHSYEFLAFLEMWNHPDSGPRGGEYWAYAFGDVFVIGLHINRVWRNWNPGRGKFSELEQHLNNPDEWGFGDMFFEHYHAGSEQYEWLLEILQSEAFKSARYRIVMGHQTMFGVGDNAIPVMADPIATITYTDLEGASQTMTKVWPYDADTWLSDVQPLIDREALTNITYDYPLENDIWRRDIEPLLLENGVHLVHAGHSHIWNRTLVGDRLHYMETSNYGNTFGAGWEGFSIRAPFGQFPGELNSVVGPHPANYPRYGDAFERPPIYPTLANPQMSMAGFARATPFVSSNNVGVFTVMDTGTGMIRSYAFDTRDPDSDVVLFDEFPIDVTEHRISPFPFSLTLDGGWQFSDWFEWIHPEFSPWVWSAWHGWTWWPRSEPGKTPANVFYFDRSLGWVYTQEAMFPMLYSYSEAAWLEYLSETREPRQFIDLRTQALIERE